MSEVFYVLVGVGLGVGLTLMLDTREDYFDEYLLIRNKLKKLERKYVRKRGKDGRFIKND